MNDVTDDRELIIATFEESEPDPGVSQGGGDGASGSSVGTGSPDIFYSSGSKFVAAHETNNNENIVPDIEVGLTVFFSSFACQNSEF